MEEAFEVFFANRRASNRKASNRSTDSEEEGGARAWEGTPARGGVRAAGGQSAAGRRGGGTVSPRSPEGRVGDHARVRDPGPGSARVCPDPAATRAAIAVCWPPALLSASRSCGA